MNEKSGIDKRTELFTELCNKYPNLKPQLIKQAINKFDFDIIKINEHLRQGSMGESPNTGSSDSMRQNSSESGNSRVFSFVSLNSGTSESSSPAPLTKNYRPSSELSKISSQKIDLKKLDDAFKRLEKHRDFLNRERLYLGEVIQRRKSELDFPNIVEVEKIDKLVNKKYSLPTKSLSYANDLRQPSDMNQRFAGFHGQYNQQPQNNNNNNNNHNRGNVAQQSNLRRDQMNPNLFHSPLAIDDHLAPFKKIEEKRYSAHFDPKSELPQEFTGNSKFRQGHHRQRSDPWSLERTSHWDCPQCYTKNSTRRCSFCEYDIEPGPQ